MEVSDDDSAHAPTCAIQEMDGLGEASWEQTCAPWTKSADDAIDNLDGQLVAIDDRSCLASLRCGHVEETSKLRKLALQLRTCEPPRGMCTKIKDVLNEDFQYQIYFFGLIF